MEERIRQVMSSTFQITIESLGDNPSSETIQQWDSIHHMKLILALEQEFHVHFSDEQLLVLTDFKSIFNVLRAMSVSS